MHRAQVPEQQRLGFETHSCHLHENGLAQFIAGQTLMKNTSPHGPSLPRASQVPCSRGLTHHPRFAASRRPLAYACSVADSPPYVHETAFCHHTGSGPPHQASTDLLSHSQAMWIYIFVRNVLWTRRLDRRRCGREPRRCKRSPESMDLAPGVANVVPETWT